MKTLNQLISGLETIPATTLWYLADISESKGKTGSRPERAARNFYITFKERCPLCLNQSLSIWKSGNCLTWKLSNVKDKLGQVIM
jgi:hypothetical protein